jgi:hypothetical protein
MFHRCIYPNLAQWILPSPKTERLGIFIHFITGGGDYDATHRFIYIQACGFA